MFFLAHFLGLDKGLSNGSDSDSIICALCNYRFASTLIIPSFIVFVAFHCEGFPGTSLTVGEDGCMEAFYDLGD